MTVLHLHEWEVRTPVSEPALAGLTFGSDSQARSLAETLRTTERVEILEMASGLAISTSSFVGRVQVGPLALIIHPKLDGMPLLTLLRYAYGLRDLDLHSVVSHHTTTSPLQELLVHQLLAEATELVARGLHREYTRRTEDLASPRGRLDLQRYARQAGQGAATLPCIIYPRLEDAVLNQVLLAGLRYAVPMTTDLGLRTHLRRLIQQLDGGISQVILNAATLRNARRALDRRSSAYAPVLTLLELLVAGGGVTLDEQEGANVPLPGFLFDMNRFFQTLLSRLLHEYLSDVTVQDEYRLKGMMRYAEGYNPQRRQAPEPRPDFVLLQGGKILTILDAKYRDLWQRTLPRDMLYQLAIYALSQGAGATATILYPTLDEAAREARIEIRDPLLGATRACVVLRPVNLNRLASALEDSDRPKGKAAVAMLVHQMAFGSP